MGSFTFTSEGKNNEVQCFNNSNAQSTSKSGTCNDYAIGTAVDGIFPNEKQSQGVINESKNSRSIDDHTQQESMSKSSLFEGNNQVVSTTRRTTRNEERSLFLHGMPTATAEQQQHPNIMSSTSNLATPNVAASSNQNSSNNATTRFPSNNPTIHPTTLLQQGVQVIPSVAANVGGTLNSTIHSGLTLQQQAAAAQLNHVQQLQQLHAQVLNYQPYSLSTTPSLANQHSSIGMANAVNILNAQQQQQVIYHQNTNPLLSMTTPLTNNVIYSVTNPTSPMTNTTIPPSIHLPTPNIGLTVQDHPFQNPVYNGVNPKYPNLQVLNQNPPIFTVTNFLTPTECNFLINVAQDCFTPAPVVGKGGGEVSASRTSSTCYLAREDLPRYLAKVSLLTGKPIEHCELPQVGRYFPSQQYLQHFDAFDLSNEDGVRFASNGGQRTVTVLVYLNDVERGGHTSFPNLNLEVKPKRGMALVFFPSTVDGLLDKNALHAAKPAVDTKYVSQVWIRQGRYDGMPSKRMFASVDQAMIVQKSLIASVEGNEAADDLELLSAALR